MKSVSFRVTVYYRHISQLASPELLHRIIILLNHQQSVAQNVWFLYCETTNYKDNPVNPEFT